LIGGNILWEVHRSSDAALADSRQRSPAVLRPIGQFLIIIDYRNVSSDIEFPVAFGRL